MSVSGCSLAATEPLKLYPSVGFSWIKDSLACETLKEGSSEGGATLEIIPSRSSTEARMLEALLRELYAFTGRMLSILVFCSSISVFLNSLFKSFRTDDVSTLLVEIARLVSLIPVI